MKRNRRAVGVALFLVFLFCGLPLAAWAGTVGIGVSATVKGPNGSGVSLWSGPSTVFSRVTILAENAPVVIIDGPKSADGHTWWKVRTSSGTTGWVAATYLAAKDGGSTQPQQVPAPKATVQITALGLNDIDGSKLEYLSVAPHAYFGGFTRIQGTISVNGQANDQLKSLTLEMVENGRVVATAYLTASAQQTLYKPFGSSGKIGITGSRLLFEFNPSQSNGIDLSNDGRITLRARAITRNGAEATREYGTVTKLVRYTGSNRYGTDRDEDEGGDAWVRPSVKQAVEYFSTKYPQLRWNDFSNMNGGFFIGHDSHRVGLDVDGLYAGYTKLDGAVAQFLLQLANDPRYGARLEYIFVTYNKKDSDPIYRVLKGVKLRDGRLAENVIFPWPNHADHFHLRFK